jgi:hypothetical protein
MVLVARLNLEAKITGLGKELADAEAKFKKLRHGMGQ